MKSTLSHKELGVFLAGCFAFWRSQGLKDFGSFATETEQVARIAAWTETLLDLDLNPKVLEMARKNAFLAFREMPTVGEFAKYCWQIERENSCFLPAGLDSRGFMALVRVYSWDTPQDVQNRKFERISRDGLSELPESLPMVLPEKEPGEPHKTPNLDERLKRLELAKRMKP